MHIVRLVGKITEREIAKRLHTLSHAGNVEYVSLSHEDMKRRRLRVTTDKGTDCSIALPRDQRLQNGAVLLLDETRCIVVRTTEERWLAVEPRDSAAALELGYFAGNLHWQVRFAGARLLVAMDVAEEDYLDRLKPFLVDGRATRVPNA